MIYTLMQDLSVMYIFHKHTFLSVILKTVIYARYIYFLRLYIFFMIHIISNQTISNNPN